uniref:Reverse transcriptase zinc-binding domain-containing protein n=1 Tax=Brassica oleracea TaxID=3712 RepID=A0A3P6AKQ3_BRAOL|nr:unnamed protein product [Brassica oleracea]
MLIYNATSQSVTCGVTILSENISLTFTFVYGFNLVEERRCLWDSLVRMQEGSPVAAHPWSVLGDFNQMLRTSHHSNHISTLVDVAGMDDANLSLQDAQLFEAQVKGLPYTWRNMQDDNPISTKIDHAFINQAWSSSFPDSYAEFLDPSQSDHAPCLFRMPSISRRIVKPFKFFHHVIDHPEYAGTVSESWNCGEIVGTNQFKLVRSLKKLKRPLRSLNKRHFSGITQRVKAQKEIVDAHQRTLLTALNQNTAWEEHSERDKLNVLLTAEEKYYRQRSRVRWADVGDRNTPFYHKTVSQHASRNHIHYLKDSNDHLLFSTDAIKAHAADYFQGILGSTDLPLSNQSGGFGTSFSSRVTWERIRTPLPSVQWHSVVWFKEEIPRCSFISWTAFLGSLPTRDRLISWGIYVPPGCCTFASAAWLRFCGRYMVAPPASLTVVVDICRNLQGPHAQRAVIILKLLSQVIAYNLWRERNARIFRDVSLTTEGFFRVVDRGLRDRLLSPSLASTSSPSLLELYFWFLSPYS